MRYGWGLQRRTGPSGDQQDAELIAVQGGGVRVIIQPRPADMSGWGMLQELRAAGICPVCALP